MALVCTEVSYSLTCQLIRLAHTIEMHQAATYLLGNFRGLEVHIVLLKDSAAAIKQQQGLAKMAL